MATTREVPLIMEDCALMTAGCDYCDSLFGLEPGFDPAKAQDLIEDFLERFRAGKVLEPINANAAAYLGCFWAMTISMAYDWNFVAVAHGEWRGLGVADKERKYLAIPINFFPNTDVRSRWQGNPWTSSQVQGDWRKLPADVNAGCIDRDNKLTCD